jgi:hypothetical protein
VGREWSARRKRGRYGADEEAEVKEEKERRTSIDPGAVDVDRLREVCRKQESVSKASSTAQGGQIVRLMSIWRKNQSQFRSERAEGKRRTHQEVLPAVLAVQPTSLVLRIPASRGGNRSGGKSKRKREHQHR